MALELKITSPSPEGFVKEIIWNADEISAALEEKVGYYKNLLYTDEQMVEAKKDRATLNKFIAALKAKDREIKDLCLAPYEVFHNRMLKIIAQVEEPASLIDNQVKAFEEEQKKKKRADIEELFKSKGFQPWVTLDRIWDPKWLNKTCTMKQIDDAFNKIMYQIGEDIFLLNKQGEGTRAALAEYKRTMNVRAALSAAENYLEVKRAEEALKASTAQVIGMEAADAEIPGQVTLEEALHEEYPQEPVQKAAPQPLPLDRELSEAVPMRKEIFFKVFVSREELAALNTYLKTSGITFRQIKEHN
jgi:hypothetical protein